ncbi:NAD-dependent epimerase/dehydratase family protein [Haliea sp.]
MRVLVTGHRGYLGTALVPRLLAAGHEVNGLDVDWYRACDFGAQPVSIAAINRDIRDVHWHDLKGYEALVHLAGLCNDPLGELDPALTMSINADATVELAHKARRAGVERFVFSSSCSNYGAAGDTVVTETSPFNPVTAYGRSKVVAEQGLERLAGDTFTPVYLRNATVYGYSPRIRFDLVVNNLVAWAATTGKVLLKSRGLAWRPLVHIEDVASAFVAVLGAPRDSVHNEAFNIGVTADNYRVAELAQRVVSRIPGSELAMVEGAQADTRSYRVNCDKALALLDGWQPRHCLDDGIGDLYRRFLAHELGREDFEGQRYQRLAHLRSLLADGSLGPDLRRPPGLRP